MTLSNAPYLIGGIYCNGTYDNCEAITPPINNFDFSSFSVSADFMVTEYRTHPVFVCGTGCRWLGFYLTQEGTVELLYNNANYLASTRAYSLNKWHNATITYNGIMAHLYLDNEEACSVTYQPDHAVCGAYDTRIGIINYSNGNVYKGYLRELKVSSDGSTAVAGITEESALKIYPNPANSILFIEGLTNNPTVTIYNMTGSMVIKTNLSENKVDISHLPAGFYIMELTKKGKSIIRRFIKQ